MTDKIVITGVGLVTSLGHNITESWEAIVSGRSGIGRITAFDAGSFECRHAAEVTGIGAEELNVHPRDSRIMDRHAYMLMKSGRDAFAGARLDAGPAAPEEIGFFAGMGMVDYMVADILPSVLSSLDRQGALDYDAFFSEGYRKIHPLWPLSMLNNISFCQVAIDLGIKGENTVFCAHGDSGIHAIIEACHVVSEKKVKAALAGGVSEKVSPQSLARASLAGILARTGSEDTFPCRPFGKNRGTILGEGCGMLALELASSSEKRGLQRLAAITGYGASCGPDNAGRGPSSGAIMLAMEQALAGAGLAPSDIDAVIAHGDGTEFGDRSEAGAIQQTFHDGTRRIPVYSSKAAIGNLLAGAAAADVILGICMLQHGIIPPVCGPYSIDNEISLHVIHGEPLRAPLGRILINTRSNEGQCASLIIEKAD